MNGNRKWGRVGFAPVVVGIVLAGAGWVSPVRAKDDKTASHLIFVRADKEAEAYDDLAKCEQLTIEKYRELGVQVTEVTPDELRAWLKVEGKPFAKGNRKMQLFHLAKAKGAQAYGGLVSQPVTKELAIDLGVKEGTYFFPWGASLDGCSGRSSWDLTGGASVRAIPLKLGGEGDPWELTRKIEAELPPTGPFDTGFAPHKGRPFLGVRTDGARLTHVIDESPAKQAGLLVGDMLLKVNGAPIANQGSIAAALENEKPGNEIEVVFERDGKENAKRVALADYDEIVNVKLSPMGKPLRELKATDATGKEVSLDQFKGKLLMVDFWATWCEPCKDEMPVLQAAYEKFRDRGVAWLGVSVDTDDVHRLWKAMVERNGLGGVQVRSPEWGDTMNISSYPTILIVDQKGVVRAEVRGERIAEVLEGLLGEEARTSSGEAAADAK